jgi:hypothetical protein
MQYNGEKLDIPENAAGITGHPWGVESIHSLYNL